MLSKRWVHFLRSISKRGIAPLIATVLIIGFTVASSAVVMYWGEDFTQSNIEQTELSASSSLACSSVVLDVSQAVCDAQGVVSSVHVINNGQSPFVSFKVRLTDNTGSTEVLDVTQSLSSAASGDLSFSSTSFYPSTLEVFPVLEGEVICDVFASQSLPCGEAPLGFDPLGLSDPLDTTFEEFASPYETLFSGGSCNDLCAGDPLCVADCELYSQGITCDPTTPLCTNYANAEGTCDTSGFCLFVSCNEGFSDDDQDLLNGCEFPEISQTPAGTELDGGEGGGGSFYNPQFSCDPTISSCTNYPHAQGRCDIVRANIYAYCTFLACDSGYLDNDNDLSNGCETFISSPPPEQPL